MDVTGAVMWIISMVLGTVVMFGGPVVSLVLQGMAPWNWNGWWRVAAIAPLVVMALTTVGMVHGVREGSNLAPLVFILSAPVAAVWLVVFAFLRGRFFS